MKSETILAMMSERGEILLADKRDNFFASFQDGKWIADDIFEFESLVEDFWHIRCKQKIDELLNEARAALKQL